LKLRQSSLGVANYISSEKQHEVIVDYLETVRRIHQIKAELNAIYSDPKIEDPEVYSQDLRIELEEVSQQNRLIKPHAEDILQSQISNIVADFGLTYGGQPVPPVLYHNTPLPLALIISPRDVIRQELDISLISDLSLEQQIELEDQVDAELDVSSLVVPIGGVGVYPTMVQETTSLDWLSEVVAHEWIHNFLTLRPLGMNYLTSNELRVMNETAASIAGKEIGRKVLETFYSEMLPPPPPKPSSVESEGNEPVEPPEFDFRAEMHETRINVDEMLGEGLVEEAEAYMEERREIFWENGYQIRKLNQAYFAFYGAYADEPGGAAGAVEDPVGEAVRSLRQQSPSLASFLKRIAWMWSFEQLRNAVE
jgi:hypothetical protein